MKRFLSLAIAILIALNIASVNAKIRTSAEVLTIAQQHFATKTAKARSTSPQIVKTISASEILPQPKTRSSGISGEPFYVLVASNGSNVIVSGDDRMPTIIGYSEYEFDKNNVNDGLKALLSAYSMAYNDLQTTGTSKLERAPQTYASTSFPSEVKPLLDGIAWNQVAPYNGMSPIVNTSTGQLGYTGCVTTAMAMIMRYHKYPARAIGRGTSETSNINDIDLTTYPLDWDKMQKRYTENHVTDPKENRDAVAWLMRACGAALDTKYFTHSSGSGEHMIAQVFANNFGYDQGVVTLSRNSKTYQQWTDILKLEISSGRPVLYTATATGSIVGHAIVFDGYNTDGLYYVNWGWTTSGNGYYDVTSLGGYTDSQGATIGIQKPTGAPYVSKFERSSERMDISPTLVNRNGSFTVKESWNYVNRGDTFTGQIGLVLFQNGEFVATVGDPVRFNNILRNYALGDGVLLGFKNVTISGNVPNGSYQIYVASKDDREATWQPVTMETERLPYYNVVINSSQIVFSSPVVSAVPKVLSFKSNVEKIYYREDIRFNLQVQYDGTEINTFLKITLTSRTTGKVEELNILRYALVPGINEIQFSKRIGFDSGDYKLDVQYLSGATYYSLDGCDAIGDITIYGENYEQYDYNVRASYAGMEKETITNKDGKPRLVLNLVNVGAKDIEGGKIHLTTNGNGLSNIDFINVSIKKGETQKLVLESSAICQDGNGYTLGVQFAYPSGGTTPKTQLIPNVETSYEFGVRTLGNGK